MIWEALNTHPDTWIACAIGSDPSRAVVRALVLLVIPFCSAYPLPITVLFCLLWSCNQLMNRPNSHICRCLLLRYNPAVPDELPCQLLTENKECGAARNGTVCKSKVPKSQECIHLRDCQDEREHPNLPSLSFPSVLN